MADPALARNALCRVLKIPTPTPGSPHEKALDHFLSALADYTLEVQAERRAADIRPREIGDG